jgi:hypothetical protein
LKEVLIPIQGATESVLKNLQEIKEFMEMGKIPFVERDYFNLVIAMERIKEAKERLDGIILRQ